MSMWAHSAVAPFVQDQTWPMVSRRHSTAGVVSVAGLASPPHKSTAVSPLTFTQTDAPTSPRSAKLRSNSSRTWENRPVQVPPTVMTTPYVQFRLLRGGTSNAYPREQRRRFPGGIRGGLPFGARQ
jgi:hypothetical protein